MTTPIAGIKHWILLRGLSRERRHWGVFFKLLQGALPGRHFHCLDLPGTGEHYTERSPCSAGGICRHIEAQCEAKNIQQPFGVIGLSLGGMVTLEWMAATDHVAAVVVINTSANNFTWSQRIRPTALGLVLRALFSFDIETQERLILRMGSRKHAGNPAMLDEWVAIQRARPVKHRVILAQLLAAARFSLPDNLYRTPGLVLASDSDGMVSSRCSEKIASRYQWPLRCHVEAGHDLPLDEPEWVVEQLQNWIESS